MGHFVTGLIATQPVLQKFAARHMLHPPILLTPDLAILPLADESIDTFVIAPQGDYRPGFSYLSERLVSLLSEASNEGTIMYFETEYFGGSGTQGAAVFAAGVFVLEPESAKLGPVNRGLALLGVRTQPPARDEFETVGLHRHRSVEDWLNEEN